MLGRHVESLNFIELILGDKRLFRRPGLLSAQPSADPDEVAFQAEALLKTMPLLQYYEEVALPALALAQVDVSAA